MPYEKAFSDLLSFIKTSRDFVVTNSTGYFAAKNSIIKYTDENYFSYQTLIEKYEVNATSTVEQLAVHLMEAKHVEGYSLYPVEQQLLLRYPNFSASQFRPFEIIIKDNNSQTGVIFYISQPEAYIDKFCRGTYCVDKLILVWISDPNELAYDVLITHENAKAKKQGIAVTRVTLKEFWETYFGTNEYSSLMQHIETFNEQAKGIIGFNTVIAPTEEALKKFKISTGELLKNFSYMSIIPTNLNLGNISNAVNHYLSNNLWEIMLTDKNFGVSFISSEWYFNMYQLTQNLDLTGIISGYIKSVEQLLFAIFAVKNVSVKDIKGNFQKFQGEDNNTILITLGSLEKAVEYKNWMFNVDPDAHKCISQIIKDWNNKYRKKYFHRENLSSPAIVHEVRNQAILLYALLLGGISMRKDQLTKLTQ